MAASVGRFGRLAFRTNSSFRCAYFGLNRIPKINGIAFKKYIGSRSSTSSSHQFKNDRRFFLYGGLFSFLGGGTTQKKEKEDELIHTIKLAVLNVQKGDLEKAEQILHLALKIAQERLDQQGITYVYDMLANVALQKGDYQKAEKLFVELLQRMLAYGRSKMDNAVVEISLKLASIYSMLGDDSKAEEGYKFCIDTQQKKLAKKEPESDDDTMLLWAMSVDWYARYLMNQNRFREAREYFRKALDMSTKVNGPKHPQTLVLMNDLGSVSSLMQDYKSSIDYLKKAIDVGLETKAFDLPSFYCNLAAVYMQQGKMRNAKEVCELAVNYAKQFGNKEAESEAQETLNEIHKISDKSDK